MSTSSAPAVEGRPGSSTDGSAGEIAADADTAAFPLDRFPYRVVADRLEARIRRGEFGETGRLPSARELMAHYGVTLSVVTHARREMKERGLIYSAGPHGTFVT